MTYREETLARAFANALDADDFAAAAGLLAQGCVYSIRDASHEGPDAIVASYREGSEKAGLFDGCRYESAVEDTAVGRATVRFLDHLTHAGEEHTHSCLQHLGFAADGRIESIRHEDLPGERSALKAFCDRVGVGL